MIQKDSKRKEDSAMNLQKEEKEEAGLNDSRVTNKGRPAAFRVDNCVSKN